ncbi:serine protease, partial [Methylococcaceae bacterium HT1]
EQAVRAAASLSASEALELNVIDIVASDVSDLFRQLQGRKLNTAGKELILNTEHYEIQSIQPDWRSDFLAVITNPSIAYILLMVGMYGLVLEFSNPGVLFLALSVVLVYYWLYMPYSYCRLIMLVWV